MVHLSLPDEVYQGLFPKNTCLPEFYGLPKIHKVGAPLRPVVAAFGGPMSRLSVLLERILHKLLKFLPAHIGSTQDAISSLKRIFPDLKAPKNTILVTMDVVALYPSIPIEDGISAVREMLQHHGEEIDMLGLTCDEIVRLIRFVLKTTTLGLTVQCINNDKE